MDLSKYQPNFESGELDEKVVCSILEITTQHGAIADKTQNKPTKFFNFDKEVKKLLKGK